MRARFWKMHGLGNDFVIIDERAKRLALTPGQAQAIAARHTGIGCDQVIRLTSATHAGADAAMAILNADGSPAGACGNATRCIAELLFRETGQASFRIETEAGVLEAERRDDGRIQVDMGEPRLSWADVPLAEPLDTLSLPLALGPLSSPAACSMGNPHVTFFVSDVEAVPLATLGPALERAPLFPERANIGVAQILAPDRLRVRVWERGAGLTRACGSGACAAAVNANRRGLANRRLTVVLDGGELEIFWRDDNHVLMTGPAAPVFVGELDLSVFPS